MCQDTEVKIRDLSKIPELGWRYTSPDTGHQHTADTYEALVSSVAREKVQRGIQIPTYLEQMIQDQICDQNGGYGCESVGLGDMVHAVAQPIAKVIDRVAGTNVQGCGACAKRRAMLNSTI